MSWLVDPDAVAAEYASEQALRERVLAHRELVEGPDDEAIVRARVLAARPRRLVEVGSGLGDFCAWASAKLGGEVVAVDASPRMVELAAQPGVEAVVADMRQLPFADAAFDCVVANFVLYHIPDPVIAIAEFARVLEPGGILVASTLSDDTDSRLQAWATLFREEKQPASPALSFSRENGRALLLRHFRHVEQTDCDAVLVFPTRERSCPLRRSGSADEGHRLAPARHRGTVPSARKDDGLPGERAEIDDAVLRERAGPTPD